MKKNIFSPIVIAILMLSCFNDLDPKDQGDRVTNSGNVYNSKAYFLGGLAKLYANFATTGQKGPTGDPDITSISDEGFTSYLRQYWNAQVLSTDEAVIAWNDETIKDFHWHTWTSNDVFIRGLYARIIFTITSCNEFIRATEGNKDTDVVKYISEARFIRALVYFHGLDLFGNMPFITEEDLPGGSFSPKQINREDLFNYIENELKDIEPLLGDYRFEYGRADKGACQMLQAKLYLNAKVYIGEDKNTKALEALNKLIKEGDYVLNANFANNFNADNDTNGAQNENIFTINFDGIKTTTYGGTVYLIHAAIGGSMIPQDYGVGSGWGGIRTTEQVVALFDARPQDYRRMFYSEGQSLKINDIGTFTDGYAVTKFSNLTSTGDVAHSNHADFVDTDFPMFRLADAYLMYAEAVLRGGSGGSRGEALNYINMLQERAKLSNISEGELTLDFILDERVRELLWEGHRRTDLIRFEKFTGGNYLWAWKGKTASGSPTEEFRNLYPIPSSDIASNLNMKQNPGY